MTNKDIFEDVILDVAARYKYPLKFSPVSTKNVSSWWFDKLNDYGGIFQFFWKDFVDIHKTLAYLFRNDIHNKTRLLYFAYEILKQLMYKPSLSSMLWCFLYCVGYYDPFNGNVSAATIRQLFSFTEDLLGSPADPMLLDFVIAYKAGVCIVFAEDIDLRGAQAEPEFKTLVYLGRHHAENKKGLLEGLINNKMQVEFFLKLLANKDKYSHGKEVAR